MKIVGIGGVGFQSAMQPDQGKFNVIKCLIEEKGFRRILLDLPDYQLREINQYLNDSGIDSNVGALDSIINRQAVYDLGVVLSTKEFRNLVNYLKERNLQNSSAASLGGFGVGIPSPSYFLAKYMLKRDSVFTVEMNRKIVNQLDGKGDVLTFSDLVDWYNAKKEFLIGKLNVDDFRKLTTDIDNIKVFMHLNTINETREFMAYRDSCAANHIINQLDEKTIILSRNLQIAEYITDQVSGTEIKTLGSYLNKIFQNNYYSILVDFSDRMTYVSVDRSKKLELKALSGSIANILKKNFKINEGLFIFSDFHQARMPLMLNNIIANPPPNEESLSLVTGSNKSFDAFFILEDIHSTSLKIN